MPISVSCGLRTRPCLCCEPLKKAALVTLGINTPFYLPLKTCLHFREVLSVWSRSVFCRPRSTAHNSNDRLNFKPPSSPALDYSAAEDQSFSVLGATASQIFLSGLRWWIRRCQCNFFFVLCFIRLLLCLLNSCIFPCGRQHNQTARSRCRYMDVCVQLCLDLLW